MATVTYYVALPFTRDETGNPVAGEPKEARDGGQASRYALAFASADGACGAVAFSRTGDPAVGEFDDAVVINSIGEVGDLA